MVLAAPLSSLNSSLSHSIISSSSNSSLFSTSALNLPTDSDKSNERGNISPDHEGTVGFLPSPSLTIAVVLLHSKN